MKFLVRFEVISCLIKEWHTIRNKRVLVLMIFSKDMFSELEYYIYNVLKIDLVVF